MIKAPTNSNFTLKDLGRLVENNESPSVSIARSILSKIKTALPKDPYDLSPYETGSLSDLLQSLFLGKEGKYKILEIPVYFAKKTESAKEDNFLDSIGKIYNYVTRLMFFSNINTFIHEMGHALAFQAFDKKTLIFVYTNATNGLAGYASSPESLFESLKSLWNQKETRLFGFSLNEKQINSIICTAGPISSAISCSLGMLFATALNKCNLIPTWMTTAIKIVSITNLAGELNYAINSFIKQDKGDFGLIAKNGLPDLLLAGTSLILASSLGFIGSQGWELSSLSRRILLNLIFSHLIDTRQTQL